MSKSNIALFTGALISADPMMGQITVANSAQMDAANMSIAMNAYIVGSPAPDLEAQLETLFPSVPTSRMVEFQKHDDESFLTETDGSDERAAGAAFKMVEYNGDKGLAKVGNKGLTIRVDHDRLERDASGNIRTGWEQRYVDNLRLRLIRAEILRGFKALDAAATNANKVWDAASNPDADLRAGIRAAHLDSKLKPNRVVMGDLSWQLRQDAYEDESRANHSMSKHAEYSEEDLARYLTVESVMRHEDLYQEKKKGNGIEMLGQTLIYNAQAGQTIDDPSNIKRFVSNTDAGGRWGVYVKEHTKFTDITVEHYSTFVSPLTKGVRKITASA